MLISYLYSSFDPPPQAVLKLAMLGLSTISSRPRRWSSCQTWENCTRERRPSSSKRFDFTASQMSNLIAKFGPHFLLLISLLADDDGGVFVLEFWSIFLLANKNSLYLFKYILYRYFDVHLHLD
jgi:hypothetical protein